uniref:Uncharacterized protein n=1 Tax=Acrobeloides nanus TaxID=290746 RepID=A0A914DME1_9BILA
MMLFRVCLISRNYYNVIRHMLLSYDKVEVGSMIDYDGDKISAILFNRICYSPEEPIVMSAYMAIYWLNIAQKKRLLQLRASCRDYSNLWSYMAIPGWEEIAVIYFREQKFRTNKVEEIEVISKKTNIEVTKLVAYIAYGTSFPFYLTSARTMEIVIDGFDLGCLRNSRSIEAYVTNDCTERLQLEIESGDLCEFDDISIFFRLLSKVYTNLKEVKLSVWLARSLPWDKPERLKSCLEKSNQLINNYIMAIETQPKSRFKIEIHLEINETLMQKKDEIDRVFDEVLPDLEKKREEFRISTFN